jgi:hypothetical protein
MTSTEESGDDRAVVVTGIPSTAPANPAIQTSAYVAFATLLVNGLALFSIPLSGDQRVYLIGTITFIAPLVTGVLIRFKVFSPKTVEQIESAYQLAILDRDARIAKLEATGSMLAALKEALPQKVLVAPVAAPGPMPTWPSQINREPALGHYSPAPPPLASVEETQPASSQEAQPPLPSGYRRHARKE